MPSFAYVGAKTNLGANTNLGEVEIICLSSTSPANAAMARAVKMKAYCAALMRLNLTR
ncbi:MAG: hypothetical protein ISQ26_08035 [Candidatus Puniceispirillum sp.]|nr:hypothetical protein [Candidatus Puniceispirillum sp.]